MPSRKLTFLDSGGGDARAKSPVCTALPGVPTDIAMEDWDELFCAVKARLRLIGSERSSATPEPPQRDAVVRIQASVLECVEALDQLHATHWSQFGRRQRLEL